MTATSIIDDSMMRSTRLVSLGCLQSSSQTSRGACRGYLRNLGLLADGRTLPSHVQFCIPQQGHIWESSQARPSSGCTLFNWFTFQGFAWTLSLMSKRLSSEGCWCCWTAEGGLTNGKGMMRFSRGFMRFAQDRPVVPVALRASLPWGITTHTLTSSFLANLFWFCFAPSVTLAVTVLPALSRRKVRVAAANVGPQP